MSLPDTVARFVAETRPFDGPIDASARKVSEWGRAADRASLQARKALLAAADAADRAAASQAAAKDAAEKLARGEATESEAAKAAASAARDLERASIAQREAQLAAADAAEKAARQYRQEARDAELAAAAQQLGALKAAGATRDYNNLLERLKNEHGDLSHTAVAGFQAMESEGNAAYQALTSAGESLAEVNKLWVVGIVNGLAMLPTLASAAAGAITIGLGGALTAVGVMVAAKNAEVRGMFQGLGHDVFNGLSRDAAPFIGTLEHIAQVADDEFHSWEPTLSKVFAVLAPTADKAVTTILHSLDELKPAATQVSQAFSAVMNAIDASAGQDMHNIAVGIEAIAQGAAKNPQAIASFITDLTEIVRYGGDVIGFLTRFKNIFQNTLDIIGAGGPQALLQFIDGLTKLGGWLGKITGLSHGAGSGAKALGGALDQAGTSTDTMTDHTRQLLTAQQAATMSTDQLKNALDRLTGANQNAFDAETQYRQAMLDALAAAKKSNAGIDGNSAAAVRNRQALSAMAQAIRGVMENSHPTTAAIEAMRQKFISTAEQMGVSRSEARKLADQLLGVRDSANKIPSKKQIDVMAKTAIARGQIEQFLYWAESQHINIGTSINTFHGATGGPVHLAGGGPSGYVRGPGGPTSDAVPAMLSNGEYVINAKQTARHRPLLEAINRGIDGFASGGSLDGTLHTVLGRGAGASLSAGVRRSSGRELAHLAALDRAAARLARGRARPEYLSALAAQESLARMRRTVYGGWFSGGPSFVGSAHGSVVQHTSTVNVYVQGNVVTERKLVEAVRRGLAQRSVLNAGNNGATIPRTV